MNGDCLGTAWFICIVYTHTQTQTAVLTPVCLADWVASAFCFKCFLHFVTTFASHCLCREIFHKSATPGDGGTLWRQRGGWPPQCQVPSGSGSGSGRRKTEDGRHEKMDMELQLSSWKWASTLMVYNEKGLRQIKKWDLLCACRVSLVCVACVLVCVWSVRATLALLSSTWHWWVSCGHNSTPGHTVPSWPGHTIIFFMNVFWLSPNRLLTNRSSWTTNFDDSCGRCRFNGFLMTHRVTVPIPSSQFPFPVPIPSASWRKVKNN